MSDNEKRAPKCETCGREMKPHGYQVVNDRDALLWLCDGEHSHRPVKTITEAR